MAKTAIALDVAAAPACRERPMVGIDLDPLAHPSAITGVSAS